MEKCSNETIFFLTDSENTQKNCFSVSPDSLPLWISFLAFLIYPVGLLTLLLVTLASSSSQVPGLPHSQLSSLSGLHCHSLLFLDLISLQALQACFVLYLNLRSGLSLPVPHLCPPVPPLAHGRSFRSSHQLLLQWWP